MAEIIFEEPDTETDKPFYERMRLKAITKITPLTCPNDKEAHVRIYINANKGKFQVDVAACCPEFEELARKALFPYAEK